MKRIRPALRSFSLFLRTPTLGRSIIALLALAILLLLAVNTATFVMIQRTSAYNDTVEHGQQVRLAAKDMLSQLVDAETGQRGFMLTARSEYLNVHDQAVAALPTTFERLEGLIGADEELAPRLERVRALYQQRLGLMEETIELTRTGRIGEAVSQIRGGRGKVLMDAMRAELTIIDAVEARRLVDRTNQSEHASRVTVAVNALAGVLILILAGISVWLVRRYVEEIQAARMELDRVNAGLENQVRDRTAELTRANEEIQRFAYIVSHDLRAPLVNVMGYTSELEQVGKIFDHQLTTLALTHPDAIEPEAIRAVREDIPEAVGFIRASTAKMDRLINAILKLSRDGRRALVPEALDMTAAGPGHRRQRPPSGRRRPAARSWCATCRRSKATGCRSSRSSATCSTTPSSISSPAVPIRIVVDGRDDRRRPRALSQSSTMGAAYRRGTMSGSSNCSAGPGKQDRPGEGLGSGLRPQQRAPSGRGHGAGVRAGTRLDIPSEIPHTIDRARRCRRPSMSHSVKIVMVEDDHGHAKLIEKNIRRAEHRQRHRAISPTARRRSTISSADEVRAEGPLLILLDLNLPDMSGIDILERVKSDERLRRAPVVVLTTTDDKVEIQRCYDLGCNVYITKPVDYEAFAGAIRQLGLFLSVMQAPEI